MLRHSILPALALAATFACPPAHAGQRAFIVSTGNDANSVTGCTPSAPCRSLQGAHGAVDAGGEIVALDTAGYGTVVITKSVSILGNPGVIASISVASGAGVAIATPGVNVILRNVNINGVGGGFGVMLTAGNSLTLENCVVSNLGVGVRIDAAARVRIVNSVMRGNAGRGAWIGGNATVDVVNSRFLGNGGQGLLADSSAGGTTSVSVSDSVASGNDIGFNAGAYGGTARMAVIRSTAANNVTGFLADRGSLSDVSVMTVGSSMSTGNATGFVNLGATFESLGDNIVRQNTTAVSGPITAVPGI
jgi:hypothetical protein